MYYCDCVEDTEEDLDPGSGASSDAEVEMDQTLKFYYSACQSTSSKTSAPRSPQRSAYAAPASLKYDVSRIDENLYLGDCKIAQDACELRRLNIKYVLHFCKKNSN